MNDDRKIIAQCIATAGYGTCDFDPATGDTDHECYADIDRVLVNDEYWKQYEGHGENALNRDFDLGFNFHRWLLTVYDDGTLEHVRCHRDGTPE